MYSNMDKQAHGSKNSSNILWTFLQIQTLLISANVRSMRLPDLSYSLYLMNKYINYQL